eukprot:COSAG05_NODE_22569_length_264_cov_0.612121_1_plen_41_part_10
MVVVPLCYNRARRLAFVAVAAASVAASSSLRSCAAMKRSAS